MKSGNRTSDDARPRRSQKRQTASAAKRSSEIDEDADLASLVALLNDEEEDTLLITARPSRSVGSARNGSLHAAVQLPAHDAYVARDPACAWGTAETVGRLTSAFDAVVQADPSAPRVRVHDLSLQRGGPMRRHKSHQSGRDVDLAYYRRDCDRECTARTVSASDLDAHRQWRLLRHWLEREQAEFIFVDYALQRPLYEQAKSAGATPRQLARWFQYPRGPASSGGIIRHAPNHANHVHVRFRCVREGGACAPHRQRERPALAVFDIEN